MVGGNEELRCCDREMTRSEEVMGEMEMFSSMGCTHIVELPPTNAACYIDVKNLQHIIQPSTRTHHT